MKVQIEGKINAYYVQMLCMIFFPGTNFKQQQPEEGGPSLIVRVQEREDGCYAYAAMSAGDKTAEGEQFTPYKTDVTKEKTAKLAVGAAVIAAGGKLLGYRPSWGIITGVRPAKMAMDLLSKGKSPDEVRKTLVKDYFAIPKKAALATEVALTERALVGTPDKRDCSMYISIPFCPTRCAYCSFVSYTSQRLLSLIPEYLTVLTADIRRLLDEIRKLKLNLKTVYIGGGTPTILTPDQLRLLLSTVAEGCDVSALEEYTLESGRPDTITAEKFAVAKEYGVTRVSVNPQTLCNDVLQRIGRDHTADDFLRAYDIARSSGIPCINTDLIVGLPGDRFSTFARSFDKILELNPENITVHTFCVKKAADIVQQSDVYSRQGGDAGKCVDYTQIRAPKRGYVPYYMYRQKNTVGNFENVGFAHPGTEGRYNIYMMEEYHSIFAAGAGAVSKVVDYRPEEGKSPLIDRYFNHKYPYEYLRENGVEEKIAFIEKFYEERGLLS
jgi:oxygen-independent coproporphyrinogen-3 oxidase